MTDKGITTRSRSGAARECSEEDKPSVEHINPIRLEEEVDVVSSTNSEENIDIKVVKKSGDDDSSSSNGSICSSIKRINITNSNDENIEEEVSDTSFEQVIDFNIPKRLLPAYNVPEKIIIVYDCAKDEVSTGFELNGNTHCPHEMLKRSIRFFVQNKHNIDSRHEFALVIMNDNSIVWIKDFTNDVLSIINALNDLRCCETEDILDISRIFELMDKKIQLEQHTNNWNIPPRYVVRILFTYGRSFTMPQLERNKCVANILESPYFTFDILMTHETPSTNNNCIKIFEFLQNIDTKGFAYFFSVGRNACDLHIATAKLLSHPLQRPSQKIANYKINIQPDN